MASRPWETKEWKTKREEFIKLKGGKCEICGSTDKLNVAHPTSRESKFYFIGSVLREDERLRHLFYYIKEVCPKCSYASISERKTMKPEFRCGRCGFCFEKEEIKKEERELSNCSVSYPLYNNSKNEEFRKWADEVWEEHKKEEWKRYLSFETARLLCNRCHLGEHLFMDLCPICKKKYKSINYKTCFECNPDKEKLKKRIDEEKRMEEIIEIDLPCGKKGRVERGAYEIMGFFEYCHDSCNKIQDCNFIKFKEELTGDTKELEEKDIAEEKWLNSILEGGEERWSQLTDEEIEKSKEILIRLRRGGTKRKDRNNSDSVIA